MGIELEEGGEMFRAESYMKNAEFKTPPLGGLCNVVILEEFPPKRKNLCSCSIPCMVHKVKIDGALCDLGASVSLMPYSIFQKLGLGESQPTPISLQFMNGSMKCLFRYFRGCPNEK